MTKPNTKDESIKLHHQVIDGCKKFIHAYHDACALPDNEISMLMLLALCLMSGVLCLVMYVNTTGYYAPLSLIPVSMFIMCFGMLFKRMSRNRRNGLPDIWFPCFIGSYICMALNFIFWRWLSLSAQGKFSLFEPHDCVECIYSNTTNTTMNATFYQLQNQRPPFIVEILLLLISGTSLGIPMVVYPVFVDRRHRPQLEID